MIKKLKEREWEGERRRERSCKLKTAHETAQT